MKATALIFSLCITELLAFEIIVDLRSNHELLGTINGNTDEPIRHMKKYPQKLTTIGVNFTMCYDNKHLVIPYKNKTHLEKALNRTKFDKLYVLTHGFQHSIHTEPYKTLTQRLRNATYYNQATEAFRTPNTIGVVLVDWANGARAPKTRTLASLRNSYQTASANTMVVGRQIGLLCYYLVKCGIVDRENIHLIGFSLGGQVSSSSQFRVNCTVR